MTFETREGTLQYYLNLPLNSYFNVDDTIKVQNNNTISQIPGLILNNTLYNTTATNASKYLNKDYFEKVTGKNYYKNFNVQSSDTPPINAETQKDIELDYFNTLRNKRNEWVNIIRTSDNSLEINNANNQIYQIDYAINRYNWQYLNINPKLTMCRPKNLSVTNEYLTPNQIQFIAQKYHVNKQEILKNLPTYRLLLDYDLDTTEVLNLINYSKETPIYLNGHTNIPNTYEFINDLWTFYNVPTELKELVITNTSVDDTVVKIILNSLDLTENYYESALEAYNRLKVINDFEEYFNDNSTVVGKCIQILKNNKDLRPFDAFINFTYYNLSTFILPNIRYYRQKMLTPYLNHFVFSNKLYDKYHNVNTKFIDKFKQIFQALYVLNVPPERVNLYL